MSLHYLEPEKVAQNGTQDLLRQVLGQMADTLAPCAAGCGLLLLSSHHWGQLEKAKCKRLSLLGVKRHYVRGLCWKCTDSGAVGIPNKPGPKSRVRKITPETLEKLPQIWEEIRENGGGQKELGERLGVSRERARQLIRGHNLPKTHSAKERAAVFLEELEFLHSMGRGVHEISQALGMEPDALVQRVEYLRRRGKTKIHFVGWHHDSYEREAA